jgi:hypothetical protein
LTADRGLLRIKAGEIIIDASRDIEVGSSYMPF